MAKVVGIDLGTTNSAVAYCDTGAPGADAEPKIQHLLIPQLVAPGTVEARPLLPSFLYLPGPGEQVLEQEAKATRQPQRP